MSRLRSPPFLIGFKIFILLTFNLVPATTVFSFQGPREYRGRWTPPWLEIAPGPGAIAGLARDGVLVLLSRKDAGEEEEVWCPHCGGGVSYYLKLDSHDCHYCDEYLR